MLNPIDSLIADENKKNSNLPLIMKADSQQIYNFDIGFLSFLKSHLELSSNKKELLVASLESSVISILMLEMTCREKKSTTCWDLLDDTNLKGQHKRMILHNTNLHLATHFEYCSCHPSIVCIFYTAAGHSRSEKKKQLMWIRERVSFCVCTSTISMGTLIT